LSSTPSTLSGNRNIQGGDPLSPGKNRDRFHRWATLSSLKMNPYTNMKSQLPEFKTFSVEDIFEATINYWREIGEWSITTNMHLNQLYPFIEFEKPQPQKIEQQRP